MLFQLLPALLQAISFFLLGLSQASWVSQIFKGQRVCLGEGGRRSKRICGVSCAWWKTEHIEFGGERERERETELENSRIFVSPAGSVLMVEEKEGP